jgi:PAS domain S-box-containing protein
MFDRASDEALLRTFSRAGDAVLAELRDLAALAARVVRVPMATVAFVEGSHVRYPVAVGIEALPDVPLDRSFCAHALRQADVLMVPDARGDVRFAHSPLVAGATGVRFYAGAPLVPASGRGIGVVAVMDRQPRLATPEELEGLRILARQVLAQLELARSREMLEAIFRQSGEGIVVVDEDGAPQILNDEALRQRATSPDDEAERTAWLLEGGDGRVPVEETLLYRAAHGERVKNEQWQVTAPTGDTRWLTGSALPLRYPNGAPAGAILLTRDETERVRMQEELQREARFREQLVATVGHDLRTPLSGVLMGARALQQRGSLSPPDRAAVERIIRLGERMSRMVHDLLDYSRLRLGQRLTVVRGRCDLATVAGDVIATMHAAQPSRVVRLLVQGDASGEWDADRLAQVLTNLVGNALAHGSAESAVTVRIEARDEEVLLSVHNQGPPIAPDALGRIFEPFWRGAAPSDKRTSGGLGLGLYIVQEMVRAHGGTLGVRSSRSEGTTFSVALPRVASREPRPLKTAEGVPYRPG